MIALGWQFIHIHFSFKNGVPIDSATQPTFKILKTQTDDYDEYSVKVFNDLSKALSNLVELKELTSEPQFIAHPSSHKVKLGSSLVLTALAVADDNDSIFYEWKKDGKTLLTADKNRLVLFDVSIADAGSYICTAYNSFGGDFSDVAVIEVIKKEQDTTGSSELVPYRGHLAFELVVKEENIGKVHAIEYSTDNQKWKTLELIVPNVKSTVYLDKSGDGEPRRFYRVKLQD